jgi:hypothetical protein
VIDLEAVETLDRALIRSFHRSCAVEDEAVSEFEKSAERRVSRIRGGAVAEAGRTVGEEAPVIDETGVSGTNPLCAPGFHQRDLPHQ